MSLLPTIDDIPFRDISRLVISNSAFINPYSTVILNTDNSLNQLWTLVTNASTIGNPSYNADVAINASQILNSIDLLLTTLERFTSHTDNISGKSLSLGLNNANFATISSIVATVQQYKDDGSVCELVYKAFGAILNASAIINQINIMLGRIANILNIPNQIADNLDFVRLLIEEQIESDLNAFASAQLEALQYAASAAINSLINNECISQILSQIGSQELKNIIRERTSEIF
jgi:hypothetical protein